MVRVYVYTLLNNNILDSRAEKTVDYIIAGQGIAGSCMALQLLRRGKKIAVFDEPLSNHASAVAAGLFNPFTGKVMARTWMADDLFPHLFAFYQDAEKFLGHRFFYPQELYRPFLSVLEQNEWMGKSSDPRFAAYISDIYKSPTLPEVKDPFGGLLLRQTGYLDVPGFIAAVRHALQVSDAFHTEKIIPAEVEIHDDFIRYKGLRASAIIFCEGMHVATNPFFSWLPINPLKGETITIKMQPLRFIVNRGVYIVKRQGQDDEYTVGATYDFVSQSPGITQIGKDELEEKLKALLKVPYEIIGQNWGIRPTTLDQKIMVGHHPKWQNVLILNGLGTKGVSQAPYFSDQLARWLGDGHEFLREVNIERYKALYSKSA